MRGQSVVKLDEPASWSDRLTLARSLPVPGPVHGAYPIREQETPPLRMAWAWLKQSWRSPGAPSAREDRRLLAELDAAMPIWQRKSQPDFERDLITLRAQLSIHGFQRERVAQAMAAVGVIVQRQLGWQVHEVQWLGAWWMLEGRLIEMATGEGKSLVVVLAATVAALAHVPVHVMTANDYLARRDAQQWQPIYEALGLSLAWLTASSTHDQRRKAYQQDLVYVTAKEVAFDHLRDQAAKAAGLVGNMVLRGYTTQTRKLMAAKQWSSALAVLKKLINTHTPDSWIPYYKEAYLLRSDLYRKLHQPAQAIDDLSAVLRVEPTDARALFTRATLYREQLQGRMAKDDFEHACMLGSTEACKQVP